MSGFLFNATDRAQFTSVEHLRAELSASREREKRLAEALGAFPCPSWPIKDVGDCARKLSSTDSGCDFCRALAAHREAGE